MNAVWASVPPVTRVVALATVGMTVLCSLKLVTPVGLYLDWTLVVQWGQWWRVLTTFTYFGEINMWVCIHLYIL